MVTPSASAPEPPEPFRLGEHLVEPSRNLVTGPDGVSSLQPKLIDVLCAFAARPGEVISRGELIDLVWGVEFGADESLTRAISLLRKTFGEGVIETIPKRGYRLALMPAAAERPGAAPRPDRPPGRRRRIAWTAAALLILLGAAAAIAGLLSRDPAPVRSERTGILVTVAGFGAGAAPGALAEGLAASLARSPLVRVRPRGAPSLSGTLPYALQGELRRLGPEVEASAQLVDSASGELVWSGRYRRPWDPQFSARDALVSQISAELMLPLLRDAKARLGRLPVQSLEPWELILLVTWVPGDEVRPAGPPSEEAYWLQRRALSIDPDFAPAHALFAELASYHALFDPPYDNERARARARGHADRAIELAPYDAEVLYQVALHHRFAGHRAQADALLQRVIDLQPDHPLARIELAFVRGQCAGDSDWAVAQLTAMAGQLSPSSPARWVALSHLSSLYLGRGDFVRAREAALRSRAIIPMTWTGFSLAAADAALGRRDEALAALAAHRREWPNMDLRYFADHIATRWCLSGPRAPAAQAAFRRLADMIGTHR